MLKDNIKNIAHANTIWFSPTEHYTIKDIWEKRPDMFSSSKVHIYYTKRDDQIWEGKLADLVHNFDDRYDMYRKHDVERFICLNQYRPLEFTFILRTPILEKKKNDDLPDYLIRYCKFDMEACLEASKYMHRLEIKKTIVNGPATIIFWSDGTKTVVKSDKDNVPDYEKGILYAALKKLCNKKEYDIILREIDAWNEYNNIHPELFPDRIEVEKEVIENGKG